MAKTFDLVWEQQALNYQFVHAVLVLTWAGAPKVPPLLLPLSIPFLLVKNGPCFLCVWVARQAGWTKAAGRFDRLEDEDKDEEEDEYDNNGTKMEMTQLREKVQEYVEAHLDDTGAEERFRTATSKTLAKIERAVTKPKSGESSGTSAQPGILKAIGVRWR
jgi:hypothetical protein